MKTLLSLMVIAFLSLTTVAAQDEATPTPIDTTPDTGIYVTTQDFSSLRTGPGKSFTRITILPPVLTLKAVGRTADTRWMQVDYKGTRGWIASILLVWTGYVTTLPVDGII